MAFEDGLNAGQAVIDVDNLAGQSVEACFNAGKTIFETGKPVLHTIEPGINVGVRSIRQHHTGNDVHDDGEHGQTHCKIKLGVSHIASVRAQKHYLKAWVASPAEYVDSVAGLIEPDQFDPVGRAIVRLPVDQIIAVGSD